MGASILRRRRFTSRDPEHRPHGVRAILEWGVWDRVRGRRDRRPPGPPAPRVEPDLALVHDRRAPTLTWIGHASVLGRLGGEAFLIDPTFSRSAGWLYRRHGEPGLRPGKLPPLAAVLITHCHYDHLDSPTMRGLDRGVPVLAPLGLGRRLRRWGHRRVVELDWWEAVELGRLRVTFVPSRHWSRRGVWDTNASLWGGYVVEADGHAVYHAGDTGWFPGFRQIRRRFPRLEAAMLPIGGYSPAWFMGPNHLDPEQAGRAFLELGARRLLPVHWGAFQLADEPLREPAERLRRWWVETLADDGGRRLELLAVGQTAVLEGRP